MCHSHALVCYLSIFSPNSRLSRSKVRRKRLLLLLLSPSYSLHIVFELLHGTLDLVNRLLTPLHRLVRLSIEELELYLMLGRLASSPPANAPHLPQHEFSVL